MIVAVHCQMSQTMSYFHDDCNKDEPLCFFSVDTHFNVPVCLCLCICLYIQYALWKLFTYWTVQGWVQFLNENCQKWTFRGFTAQTAVEYLCCLENIVFSCLSRCRNSRTIHFPTFIQKWDTPLNCSWWRSYAALALRPGLFNFQTQKPEKLI